MKTWKVKYSYCSTDHKVWDGGKLLIGERTMHALSYHRARLVLSTMLAAEGFTLYRFLAEEVKEVV